MQRKNYSTETSQDEQGSKPPLPEFAQPPVPQVANSEDRQQPTVHNATGPRTARGKQRSKLNALKHGLFFKGVLLEEESWSDYLSLLNGLREYWQPQGTMESVEVENLATIQWRKSRFFWAENAVIREQIQFAASDSLEKQNMEALNLPREEIASGGLLKYCVLGNRFAITEAIATLRTLRITVEVVGFPENNRLVNKLCGLNPIDAFSNGVGVLYGFFASCEKWSEEKADGTGQLEHVQLMVTHIDALIELLTERATALMAFDQQRDWYKKRAGLIPGEQGSDRLLRYETHLDRQVDHIVKRLERLQRMRKGLPPPPQLDVKIS